MRNLIRTLPFVTLAGLAISCGNVTPGTSGDAGSSSGGSNGGAGNGAGTNGGAGTTGGGGTTTASGGTTGGAGMNGGAGTNGGTGGRATGGAGGAVTGAGGATTGAGGGGGAAAHVSVLQYHNTAARDGVYVDARITAAAAGTMHADTTFGAETLTGPTYAQPLYLAGANGGVDLILVGTSHNDVYALDATTGLASGNGWHVTLGTPMGPGAPGTCGSPLNPLGITATPVIDATSRTIFLDAMTSTTGNVPRHMLHALAIDNKGVDRTGWPLDVTTAAPQSGGIAFTAPIQNQRAALALLGGKVFIPFGGHIGDCLGYHGWVIGVTATGTPQVSSWATPAFAGGIWGSSGIASDGTSLYVTTGNTKATANSGAAGSNPGTWGGGEAVIKFGPTLAMPAPTATTDYFYPSTWMDMDQNDNDLGGVGALLLHVNGATPADLIMALGKDGNAYLLNRANLGGPNAAPLAILKVGGTIITAAVAYSTPTASYVVFKGAGVGCPNMTTGGYTAIKVSAASPPRLSIAWCAGANANTAPAVSMTDTAGTNSILWYGGSDGRLHGINGDTGASVRIDTTALGAMRPHQSPIIANGRIFVAADNRVFAFTP